MEAVSHPADSANPPRRASADRGWSGRLPRGHHSTRHRLLEDFSFHVRMMEQGVRPGLLALVSTPVTVDSPWGSANGEFSPLVGGGNRWTVNGQIRSFAATTRLLGRCGDRISTHEGSPPWTGQPLSVGPGTPPSTGRRGHAAFGRRQFLRRSAGCPGAAPLSARIAGKAGTAGDDRRTV